MKKLVIILIITMLIMSFKVILAEEKTNELDKYEIKTKGRIIQFVEKESKNVIHTINKVDDNPFMQLFEQKRDAELGLLDVSINDLRTIDIKEERLDLIKDIHKKDLWVKTLPQICFTEDKKNILISYNLSFAGYYDDGTLFSIAHIFVYNSKGEQIGEAYFNDRVCGFPVLSNKAEYLGFKFELPYDARKDTNPSGFAVYDFKQNKLVVEDFVQKGFSGTYPAIHNNQMLSSIKNSDLYIYAVYDFDKKKTFKKSIKKEKYFKLKDITKDGLYFKTDDINNLEFISYEKDFEIIKW